MSWKVLAKKKGIGPVVGVAAIVSFALLVGPGSALGDTVGSASSSAYAVQLKGPVPLGPLPRVSSSVPPGPDSHSENILAIPAAPLATSFTGHVEADSSIDSKITATLQSTMASQASGLPTQWNSRGYAITEDLDVLISPTAALGLVNDVVGKLPVQVPGGLPIGNAAADDVSAQGVLRDLPGRDVIRGLPVAGDTVDGVIDQVDDATDEVTKLAQNLQQGAIRADVIEAEAVAACVGGSMKFATGSRLLNVGIGTTNIPLQFSPNQKLIPDLLGISVTLWETNWNPSTLGTTDGSNTVFANALRVTAPLGIDLTVSHAEATGSCGAGDGGGPGDGGLPPIGPVRHGGLAPAAPARPVAGNPNFTG